MEVDIDFLDNSFPYFEDEISKTTKRRKNDPYWNENAVKLNFQEDSLEFTERQHALTDSTSTVCWMHLDSHSFQGIQQSSSLYENRLFPYQEPQIHQFSPIFEDEDLVSQQQWDDTPNPEDFNNNRENINQQLLLQQYGSVIPQFSVNQIIPTTEIQNSFTSGVEKKNENLIKIEPSSQCKQLSISYKLINPPNLLLKVLPGEILISKEAYLNKNDFHFRLVETVIQTQDILHVNYIQNQSCQNTSQIISEGDIKQLIGQVNENGSSRTNDTLTESIMNYLNWQKSQNQNVHQSQNIDEKDSQYFMAKTKQILKQLFKNNIHNKNELFFKYSLLKKQGGESQVISKGISSGLITKLKLKRQFIIEQLMRMGEFLFGREETFEESIKRKIANRQTPIFEEEKTESITLISSLPSQRISCQIKKEIKFLGNKKENQDGEYFLIIESYIFPNKKETAAELVQESKNQLISNSEETDFMIANKINKKICKNRKNYIETCNMLVNKYYSQYSETEQLQSQIQRLLNKRNHKFKQ